MRCSLVRNTFLIALSRHEVRFWYFCSFSIMQFFPIYYAKRSIFPYRYVDRVLSSFSLSAFCTNKSFLWSRLSYIICYFYTMLTLSYWYVSITWVAVSWRLYHYESVTHALMMSLYTKHYSRSTRSCEVFVIYTNSIILIFNGNLKVSPVLVALHKLFWLQLLFVALGADS